MGEMFFWDIGGTGFGIRYFNLLVGVFWFGYLYELLISSVKCTNCFISLISRH